MCTSILSSHYFYFPSLNCPNPLDILVGLVGPNTNSSIEAHNKVHPSSFINGVLILKILETMTQNSMIILMYTKVQIEIKKKKKGIVQIHKINQNKCRFLF